MEEAKESPYHLELRGHLGIAFVIIRQEPDGPCKHAQCRNKTEEDHDKDDVGSKGAD